MLQPKQTKFRKMHKGRNRGLAQNGNTVAFGRFGLVAADRGRITARQIEAARRAMTRHIKRGGNIWIRLFPDKPITKKPLEVRMGKGKGNVEYWVALVQPGKVMFEMAGVTEELAREFSQETNKITPKESKELIDLRKKDLDQLNQELASVRAEQFTMRIKHKTGQLNETNLLKNTRRKIARIKTLITETKNKEVK